MYYFLCVVFGIVVGVLIRCKFTYSQPVKNLTINISGDVIGDEEALEIFANRVAKKFEDGRLTKH